MGRTVDRGSLLGLALIAVVLVGTALLTYRNTEEVYENSGLVSHTHEVLGLTANLRLALVDAEVAKRNFLITGNEQELRPYEAAIGRLTERLAMLLTQTVDNLRQQVRLKRLETMVAGRIALLNEGIKLRRKDEKAVQAFLLSAKSQSQMEEIAAAVNEIEGEERELLVTRRRQSRTAHEAAVSSGLITAAVGLIMVGAFALLLHRSLGARQRSAAVLHEQREWFRTILASIGEAVIATDAEGRITFMNGMAETLTGWRHQDAKGVPLPEVFSITNEVTRKTVENPAMRALKEGRIVGLANHTILTAKDGVERPIDDSAAPIEDGQGGVNGAVLVFRDVSERKAEEQAEAEWSRLAGLRAEVGACLATDDSIASTLQKCTEVLVRQVRVAFARVWVLSEQGRVLELQASAGIYTHLDGPHRQVPVGQFKIGRIAETGKPLLTNDVATDPNISDTEWAKREGMVAFAGYPLEVEGRVLGVLAMFSRERFSESVLADLSPMAAAMAQYIERKHSAKRLLVSEDRYRMLIEVSPQVAWEGRSDGYITFCNQWWFDLTGLTMTESEGNGWTRAVHPDYRERLLNVWLEAAKRGGDYELEIPFRRAADGMYRWYLAKGLPVKNAAGEVVKWVGVAVDIHDRREAEREVRERGELLRVTLSSIGDAVMTTDTEGRINFLNEVARYLTGWSQEEAAGQPVEAVFNIVNEHNGEAVESPARRVLKEGVIVGLANHTILISKDGIRRPIDDSGAPIRVGSELVGVVVVFRDVSERKRHENRLRENQERLTLALEASDLGQYELDLETKELTRTLRHDQIFGYETMVDTWKYERFLGHVVPEERVAVNAEIERAANNDELLDVEYRIRRTDGEIRWISTKGRVQHDAEGQVRRLIGTIADTTDRRQMEEELRQFATDLSEADQRKDEFLATLAHELRNPLAPIRNGLYLMRLAGDNAEAMEQARSMMERQLGQMVRLVDDLMDVSRITRNLVELRRQRIELTTVVSMAVETSRPLIEATRQELTIRLPSEPVYLDADVTRLAQVFSNLLNNAARYTEPGGRVWLTAERAGEVVVVSVKDTGIGIPTEMLPKVFEMFTQVDRTLERSQGGLGIGLTLVKRLVEMHAGTVTAHSEGADQGSEFVIRLPMAVGPKIADSPQPGTEKELGRAVYGGGFWLWTTTETVPSRYQRC